MENPKKLAAQNPLVLKGWVYTADGKRVIEIIKTVFLEFYFSKSKQITQSPENRENA